MNSSRKQSLYFTPQYPKQEAMSVLQCGYEESLPGHYSTQKTIDHYVLHCVTSGKGIYTINGQTYRLTKGDCFLLLPDVPLLYQADLKDPWIYYWIGFTGSELSRLLSLCVINDTTPVFHFDNMEQLVNLISPLINSNPRLLSHNYHALGQLYCIFSLLIGQTDSDISLHRKDFYVNQAVAYIKDNFSNDISVQDVAHHVGLERTYLYRTFKDIMGISVQAYILKIRFEKACHLLKYSNLPLSQIAIYCGYTSAQHFSIYFQKNISMSPSQYRKSNSKKIE